MSVPVCGGAGSGCLDAEAELAGNSGKSDAAGQTSASSRGPKLAVGTFFLSCRYAWPVPLTVTQAECARDSDRRRRRNPTPTRSKGAEWVTG
jgi:hypothetical protein